MANYSLVYQELYQVTTGMTSPQTRTLPAAVKLGSAVVHATVRDNRAGNARGANVRLATATTVEIHFDGALAGGETITVNFFVIDVDDLGDSLKELLFRLERVLGHLGENSLQDKVVRDDAGNLVSYRLRLFASKLDCENATPEHSGGLQTGETARIAVTQDVDIATNDRTTLQRLLTDKIATPDVS